MTDKYWKAVAKTDKKDVYRTGGIRGSKETFFEIGKVYQVEGDPKLCENGFHFYRAKDYVFGIDLYGKDTVFLEVEPLSEVVADTEKCISTKIRVLRYVPKKERTPKKGNNSGDNNSGNSNSGNWNSGNNNSGEHNSGNYNSGDNNSGDRNSGNYNSGYYNSGSYNSGNYNSGDGNSGSWNSGDENSGNWNSGNNNSGSYNSGNWNSGNNNSGNGYYNKFCAETKYFLLDVEVSKETYNNVNFDMSWFSLIDEEGKLRGYKEAWKKCPERVLSKISGIPEFQTSTGQEKFELITGISLKSNKP